jgi:plastocyanin
VRRARLVAALAACGVLLGGGSAPAQAHEHGGGEMPGASASMMFAAFSPVQLDVLAGDTVTWTNDSARAHIVTAQDGAYESDRVAPGRTYSHTYATAGEFLYYCRLHPVMRGQVDAHVLLLDPQADAAAPGRPLSISGRAALPAGTPVAIEGDSGLGYLPAGMATVGDDGSFSTTVTPSTSTTYRAEHAGETSPPQPVAVLDRQLSVSAARHARTVAISTTVTPASPHATVVLQMRLRERFGWWPVRRMKLDHASHARFLVRHRGAVRARVLLTRADGATELARSSVVTLRAARR